MVNLQELYETILSLKEKIKKHRDDLQSNETLVRYALINPLLQALGWDVSDPEEVIPEYSTEAGRPDYALKKDGKIIAFLGAKKLHKNEELLQYVSYTLSEGVKYFITSDGATWEVYDAYKKGKLENKKIISWNIEKDLPEEVVRNVLSMPKKLVTPNISEVKVYISAEDKENKDIKQTIYNSPERQEDGKIKLWVGNEGPYTVKNSIRALKFIAEWLIKNGYITEKDLPVPAGNKSKRYLIHPDKKVFEKYATLQLFNGWYLLVHYSKKNAIKMAQFLLNKYANGIELKVEEVKND